MERVRARDAVLVVWRDVDSAWLERFAEQVRGRCEGSPQLERADRLHAAELKASSWDAAVIVGRYEGEGGPPGEVLAEVLRLLKPCGVLLLPPPPTTAPHAPPALLSCLRLSGFINVTVIADYVVAEKPNFEVGSKSSLRAGAGRESEAAVEAAWGGEAGGELVDADQLLDEADLKRPDVSSLRVCGTTGVRKACADCSCGLAEELRAETTTGNTTGKTTGNTTVKSSCGSCYLGDAFRCSTCPYLGTPAFKPGERVLLADLASDI